MKNGASLSNTVSHVQQTDEEREKEETGGNGSG
jgi:hypothetical protein